MGGACSTYAEKRGAYRVWRGSLREKDHLKDPGANERLILRWLFGKWDGGAWTGFIWYRIAPGDGHL